jgi:hypothetical protein
MASEPTNRTLRKLLTCLGFEKQDRVENNHRVFRHLESDCVAILPDNRDEEPARQADILGLRDHLAHTGHLGEEEFDTYLRNGRLPAA